MYPSELKSGLNSSINLFKQFPFDSHVTLVCKVQQSVA